MYVCLQLPLRQNANRPSCPKWQDVAEHTLTLAKDICLTTEMLLKVEQMEASRRAEEGDTLGEDGEANR